MNFLTKIQSHYRIRVVASEIKSFKVTVTFPQKVTEKEVKEVEFYIDEYSFTVPMHLTQESENTVSFFAFLDTKDKRNYDKESLARLHKTLIKFEHEHSGVSYQIEEMPYKPRENLTYKKLNDWSDLREVISQGKLRNTYMLSGSGAMAYDFDDTLALVAYADHVPIAWVALSQGMDEKGDYVADQAWFQRFVHPAYRRKNLATEMVLKILPEFRKKYPQYTSLGGDDVPTAVKKAWADFR